MEDEFVTMTEAAELLGISKATMWRRVKAGEIEVYESQVDRRRKLIRKSDIKALQSPVHLPRGKELAAQNLEA